MRSAHSLYSQPMFPFFISISTVQFTPVTQQRQGLIFHGMKLFPLHLLANTALLFFEVDRLFLSCMPWLCLESSSWQCTGQFVSYYPVPQSILMSFPWWRRYFRKNVLKAISVVTELLCTVLITGLSYVGAVKLTANWEAWVQNMSILSVSNDF